VLALVRRKDVYESHSLPLIQKEARVARKTIKVSDQSGEEIYGPGSDKKDGTATSAGGSGSGSTGSSISAAVYKQQVGGICDDLDSLDEDRVAAEKERDATYLITAWKDYLGEENEFSRLKPPETMQEAHADAAEVWGRHAAVLRRMSNTVAVRLP
jgi:hypothetical protein